MMFRFPNKTEYVTENVYQAHFPWVSMLIKTKLYDVGSGHHERWRSERSWTASLKQGELLLYNLPDAAWLVGYKYRGGSLPFWLGGQLSKAHYFMIKYS